MSFDAVSGGSRSKTVAIFDFDGTIADSLELVIREYNQLAPRYRVRPIDAADLARLRKMKARDLLRQHRVSFWKLPFLVRAMRKQMHAHVEELKPFAGMREALQSLTEAGVTCHILSTNSAANIRRFLVRHELSCFEEVIGGASMAGKAPVLKKLLRRIDIAPENVFYVGDEVRDLVAARGASVRAIAVGWGYAERETLLAERPHAVVDSPRDLVRVLLGASRTTP